MNEFLKGLAPTLASALLGPLGGVAVTAIGKIFGIDSATSSEVAKVFQDGKLTPEQLSAIKELEMQYQNDEKERGFRYAELEFKDRDSARNMAIQTHAVTPALLTWLIVVLVLTMEGAVMFKGIPENVADIVAGRILGTLDAALLMVLAFWFGTTSGSQRKDSLLANSTPVK